MKRKPRSSSGVRAKWRQRWAILSKGRIAYRFGRATQTQRATPASAWRTRCVIRRQLRALRIVPPATRVPQPWVQSRRCLVAVYSLDRLSLCVYCSPYFSSLYNPRTPHLYFCFSNSHAVSSLAYFFLNCSIPCLGSPSVGVWKARHHAIILQSACPVYQAVSGFRPERSRLSARLHCLHCSLNRPLRGFTLEFLTINCVHVGWTVIDKIVVELFSSILFVIVNWNWKCRNLFINQGSAQKSINNVLLVR